MTDVQSLRHGQAAESRRRKDSNRKKAARMLPLSWQASYDGVPGAGWYSVGATPSPRKTPHPALCRRGRGWPMSMVEINFSLAPWTFQVGDVFVWRVDPTSKQENLLGSFQQSSVTITQYASPGTEWRFNASGVPTPFQTYVTTADPRQFVDISPSKQFVDLVRSPPGVVVTDAQLRKAMVTSPIEAVVTPGVMSLSPRGYPSVAPRATHPSPLGPLLRHPRVSRLWVLGARSLRRLESLRVSI